MITNKVKYNTGLGHNVKTLGGNFKSANKCYRNSVCPKPVALGVIFGFTHTRK